MSQLPVGSFKGQVSSSVIIQVMTVFTIKSLHSAPEEIPEQH